MAETSIYIHIPFCIHRCGYCDLNTYAGFENLIPAYAHALCKEIEFLGAAMSSNLPVHTVFFGGGTPSLIPAGKLAGDERKLGVDAEKALNLLQEEGSSIAFPETGLGTFVGGGATRQAMPPAGLLKEAPPRGEGSANAGPPKPHPARDPSPGRRARNLPRTGVDGKGRGHAGCPRAQATASAARRPLAERYF